MSDNHRFDIDAFIGHDTSQVLNHCLGLLITSDALNLAGGDLTDHGPDSFSDCSLKHLIKLGDIHAQVVDIVTIHVDVEDNGDVNLNEDVVACGAGGYWLVENYVLLRDQVLRLSPRETIVHA